MMHSRLSQPLVPRVFRVRRLPTLLPVCLRARNSNEEEKKKSEKEKKKVTGACVEKEPRLRSHAGCVIGDRYC